MKIITISILLSLVSMASYAQPYYTQLENVESFLSPSLSGLSANQDLRISSAYRSNNLNIASPFHTAYLAADGRMFARMWHNSAWIGWGLGGLFDVAGSGGLSTTTVYANLAYHQLVTPTLLMSVGIGAGIDNKTINDIGSLSFPIQWKGSSFDASIPSGEVIANNTTSTLDIKAGLNATFLISNRFLFSVGASARYINSPVESFYATNKSTLSTIPQRYSLYAQVFNTIGDNLAMKTSLFTSSQGDYFSLTAGSTMEWKFSEYTEQIALVLGAYYRYTDILSPTVGIRYGKMKFSLSYDIFMSDINTLNYFYRVATEAGVNYQTSFSNDTYEQLITVCPDHF